MDLKLHFLGAAGTVTGSRYLIETPEHRVLVDCGFFQEWKHKNRNRDPFTVEPSTIDAALLTHAHLDHCGLFPKLVKEGFNAPIYCTKPTARIAEIIMLDSGRIQEEDARYKNRRYERDEGEAQIEPIYTLEDARDAAPLLKAIAFEDPVEVVDGITAQFFQSGHILGACSILVTVEQGRERRTLLFSGDIGRWDAPILQDPVGFAEADYVVMESTYGNRVHEPNDDIPQQFARIINKTFDRGGNIIIPAFAVERSQDLLYHLSNLRADKEIPPLLVFVDSPMAIKVTEVFRDNPELFDDDANALLEEGLHPCDFPGLVMSRTVDQSKGINQIRGSCIVIAGSGMCTGGRIKHHLKNNLGHEANTVLFVGYQAEGTLGRTLLEGADEVRIFRKMRKVRARVTKLNGFSGHADRDELAKWIGCLEKAPRRVFVTHGEPRAAEAWRAYLAEECGYEAICPEYRQVVELD